MDLASKEYQKNFLLEPTKLERLLGVLHECLEDRSDATPQDHFQVFMKGDRCDELSSLEKVLALENSKKHSIERVRIYSTASSTDPLKGNFEIEVDFGVMRIPKSNPSSTTPVKMVTIETKSDSPSWNRQTLSQVEEQVERTWLNQTVSVIALVGIVVFIAVFFLLSQFQLNPRLSPDDLSNRMWLDDTTLDRIEKVANENRIVTDIEMREITTQQLRNVLNHERPKPVSQKNNKGLLLFAIPFLLLVTVSVYLATACYPGAVFLWGDEVARYSALEHRRKILWGIIVAVFLGGLVSRLFWEGIRSWLAN